MREVPALSDLIAQNLAGHSDAQRVLSQVKNETAAPDALFVSLEAVLACNERERIRSFCRTVQKSLEKVRYAP